MSSEVNIVRLTNDHPLRPVDWRWSKASYLRDKKKQPNRKHDDKNTVEALRFQNALFACRSDDERLVLYDDYRDIYLAYELRDQDETVEDKEKIARNRRIHPMRYEVEARLLARETYESIAVRTHMPVGAVAWYEALFFNVRDRINSQSYVCNEVIGPALHRGMSDRDYDLLWKLFGYFAGPFVVDALVTTFVDPPRIVRPDHMDALWIADTRTTIRRKSALAARTLPINSFNQIQILELHARFMEVEQNQEAAEAGSEAMGAIKTFMEAVNFSVGKEQLSRIDTRLLPHYSAEVSVEPRAADLLLLTEGKDIPQPSEKKFPQPTV